MSAPTFAPGTRVRHTVKGITGTVDRDAVDARTRREYPGMVPVQWDGDDAWLTAPERLELAEDDAPERVVPPADLCQQCGQPHWLLIAEPNVCAILCPPCAQEFDEWADEHPDTPYTAWLKAEETVR